MKKWRQVESMILRFISEHGLDIGDELPADRKFAEMAGCSVQPVMRAMDNLARRGFLERRAGAATALASHQPIMDDHEYSFRHTVSELGCSMRNNVLELSHRTMLADENCRFEREALKALGLKIGERFFAIWRVRIIDDQPRAVHRSYLNPAHFPDSFLMDHNFEKESLIDIFNAHGYIIMLRETVLRARCPMKSEQAFLRIEADPILEAQQVLTAEQTSTQQLVPIEFLHASYVNWSYRIEGHRRP